MSSSDRRRRPVPDPTPIAGKESPDEVQGVVTALDRLAENDALSPEQVRAVVSAAIRLYTAASTRAGRELPPVEPEISTTDAVTLACALVRSQDLTPFEMAIWFSRGDTAQ
jgi:hypothetical protein